MFEHSRRYSGGTGDITVEAPSSPPHAGLRIDSPRAVVLGVQPLSTPCRLLSSDLLRSLDLDSPSSCFPEGGLFRPFESLKSTTSTIEGTPMVSSFDKRGHDVGTPHALQSKADDVVERRRCCDDDDDRSSWTTVMLKNIPNKYDDAMLADEIWRRGMGDAYSYIYAVPDPRTGLNRGYAFIDLKSHELACKFMKCFEGVQLPSRKSTKVCACMWANKQGAQSPADVGASVGGGITSSGKAWLPPSEAIHNKHNAFAVTTYEPSPDYNHAPKWLNADPYDVPYASSILKSEASDQFKIFVGGLGPQTSSKDLHNYFSKFGVVKDCVVVFCKLTGTSRGFGFCDMQTQEGFRAVFSGQPHTIGGRTIGIRRYNYSIPQSPTSSTSSRSRLSPM